MNFKGKILVIGDLITDNYIFGDVNRISPEAPVPVVNVKERKIVPGGAGNVIENLKALGAKVKQFTPNNKSEKTRIFSGGQQMLRVDQEDTSKRKYSKKELKDLEEKCVWAEKIIISDYAKGTLTNEIVKVIKKYKGKIIIDPKPKNKKLYKGFYMVTPNEKELLEMAKEEDFSKAIKKLSKELKTIIIVTRGKKGATIFIPGDKIRHIKTKEVDVIDVVGAGDTFIAMLTLAITNKKSLFESISLANKAAGVVVGKVGTYVVKLEDLK